MGNLFKRETIPKKEKVIDLSYSKAVLNAHNKYRSKHGTSNMMLNEEMCREAQNYAERLASENSLKHSDTKDGENLAMSTGNFAAQEAVDRWYSEISDYKFDNPGYSPKTGHFTQVIWVGSKEFGCGMAKTKEGATYVVGRYRPAGNIAMDNQFELNVKPAIN